MRKEDLISEVLKRMKEIIVYKDGYRNTFDFGTKDVIWLCLTGFDIMKYSIFGKLKKDEVFNMSVGDAYFYINKQPCCCNIPQINYPMAGIRDNYEMVITIELDSLNLNSGSIISDFHNFFPKYKGPIFEDVKEFKYNDRINNRFEILDL